MSVSHHIDGLDAYRALKMAIVHDLPEIYSGDVSTYDLEGRKGKKERD